MENEYPSLSEQGKNLASFALQVARRAFYEGTASIAVSDGIQRARINTCRACPAYDDIQHRCKECGCWLAGKVKFSASACPLGKWEESDKKWAEDEYETIVDSFDDETKNNLKHMSHWEENS